MILMSERVIGKGRERIVKDIETLQQALKLEEDVKQGYYTVVEENISYWLGVEEDIVDSYIKLLERTDNEKIKSTLAQIVEDSKNHMRILRSTRESLDRIVSDGLRHTNLLRELCEEFPKSELESQET